MRKNRVNALIFNVTYMEASQEKLNTQNGVTGEFKYHNNMGRGGGLWAMWRREMIFRKGEWTLTRRDGDIRVCGSISGCGVHFQ